MRMLIVCSLLGLLGFLAKSYAQYPAYQASSAVGFTCDSVGVTQVITTAANGLAWGDTVTSGGTTTYLAWCNGTNWTVVGK